jgi:chemotaxis protein methyltransferase CheR
MIDLSKSSIDLSETDFQRIAKIAKQGWGLNLDSAKKPLIKSRLGKRLTKLKLAKFDTYCKIVEAGDEEERQHFVSALTTNVTHFYREKHHFDHLETYILPNLIEKARNGMRVRIWSAGCSSGQEPYSLAGLLLKIDNKVSEFNLKILATDIDPIVLKKAKLGRYSTNECSFPTTELENRLFAKNVHAEEQREIREELRTLITFRHLNLIQPWPISGSFDVIMCRNVAIYFDKPTQNKLWRRFSDALVPEGRLYIGHSERISDPQQADLISSGVTTYNRICAK